MNSAGVAGAYFDFAIQLPEGLQAYTVNHVTPDGVIKLTQLQGIIPPATPVILRASAYQKFDLPILNTTETITAANNLRGVYTRTTSLPKGTFYTLNTAAGQPVMTSTPTPSTSTTSWTPSAPSRPMVNHQPSMVNQPTTSRADPCRPQSKGISTYATTKKSSSSKTITKQQ